MLKGKGFYLTLAAGLLFAAGLLLSQAAATAQAAEAQEETAKEALPDESALRHYARTGAFERLEAEIRRLRALDPTWQPPKDLFDPAAELGFDEGPMWQLFAEGRYAELREAIAERRQEEPGWEPSDELRRQLDLAEAQQRLEHAAEHGQWKRVIEIAKAQPNLSSCQRVNNSWTIAEAYSRSDDPDAGVEVYREILTRCDDSDILIATLQKASALLDDKRMLALHTTAEQRTDAIEDAQELRLALQQGRLAESLSEKEKVAPELLSSLADEARRSQDAETALNLGWYYAGQRQWQEAETWFKSAGEWGAGSAAVEGRVLALMRQGRSSAAEQLAAQHRASSPAIYRSYIGLLTERLGGDGRSVDMDVAAKLAAYADRSRDARVARALGWAALETQDLAAAEAWFRQSLAWGESEDAALGLAVVLQRQGDSRGFDELASAWAGRSSRIADLKAAGGAASPAAVALERDEISRCLRLTEGRQLSPGDQEIRGWCLLKAKRGGEAMEIFRRLMADARNDESYADAAHGYLLALLDRGMIEEVFEEMQRLSLPEEQSDDILAQALAAKALAAYDNGDYLYALRLIEAGARVAPLTYDTSLLKGWAYYNMGNYEKARSTFETLDQQYSTQDTRSALELIRQRKFW